MSYTPRPRNERTQEAPVVCKVIVPDANGGALDDWFRSLPTRVLKQMWDGPHSDEYEGFCDEIHAAMNERGEGRYVAV